MTTDRPLTGITEIADAMLGERGPGERLRRLRRRRRLLREEMLAVAFLFVVLAATVAVLATQWLDSGPSNSTGSPPRPSVALTLVEGTT